MSGRDPSASTTAGALLSTRAPDAAFARLLAAACLGAAPVLAAAAALTGSGHLLSVRDTTAPTDAIVVLGGFGVPRAERAARLFQDGVAPVVIVSGAGDCEAMRQTLRANGVADGAILAECGSRSTLENASATAPLLRRGDIRSVTIVTHWFHAPRALATFRAAAPEIRFSAVSVEPSATPLWRLGWKVEPVAALSEYAKIVWYAVAHGVFTRIEPRWTREGDR